MQRVYLGKGTRFLLHDRVYEITEDLNDKMRVQDRTYGGERIFEMNALLKFLDEGDLKFELQGNQNTELIGGIQQSKFTDVSMLPDRIKKKLDFRMMAIKPLLNYDGKLEPALALRERELASKGFEISTATLRRWIAAWRRSNGDIHALVPNDRGRGSDEKRLQAEVEMFLDQVIENVYKRRERITVATVMDHLVHKIDVTNNDLYRKPEERLLIPSESTIRRRILEKDPRDISKARNGAKRSFDQLAFVNLREKPKRPLERVEMDHTLLDFFVVDNNSGEPLGRPTLTTLLDCATGLPVGINVGYEPCSYAAVMLALKHAIGPKDYIKEMYKDVVNEWHAYGLPEVLVVDNGKDFLSNDLKDACVQINTTLVHCPPKKPWYKGQAERYFRTINQGLIHQLKGTTFSNVIDRGDYDPEKNACVTFSNLMEIIHIWICDIYSQRVSKGVKGIPAKLWNEGITHYGKPALPTSKLDWHIAIMKVKQGSIQRTGIQYDTMHYMSNDLGDLARKLLSKPKKNRLVSFKFDPTDLTKIYVYDEFDDKYIIAEVVEKEYANGINAYSHKVYKKLAREEYSTVNRVSLSKARIKIENLMNGDQKNLKLILRKRNARMKGISLAQEIDKHNSKKVDKNIKRLKAKEKSTSYMPDTIYEDDWGTFNEKRR